MDILTLGWLVNDNTYWCVKCGSLVIFYFDRVILHVMVMCFIKLFVKCTQLVMTWHYTTRHLRPSFIALENRAKAFYVDVWALMILTYLFCLHVVYYSIFLNYFLCHLVESSYLHNDNINSMFYVIGYFLAYFLD